MKMGCCRKALSGIGRMERLEGIARCASGRRKEMRTPFGKLNPLGAWLCWLLLVALALSPIATAQTVSYIHTNALGSVVAETDQSGNVIKRYDYEPYGGIVSGEVADGPGYTGHVSDAATGLSYMQQRYYDPMIERFLSADPVGPDVNAGANFNRYKYAANNPYTFKDPDGRQECRSCEMSYGASVGYMLRNDPDRTRVWAGGEAAAMTTGSGAMEGAALGQAVGNFVDTGNYSQQAVTTLATVVVVGALTHGKSGAGPMLGPSPKINLGQQGKHLVGHNNYIPGRSVLTENPSELGRSAGTGQQVGKIDIGLPGSKERISFGKEVGSYVDPAGNATPTTNAIIHYGKDGIHIVPSRPDP